MKKTTKYNIIFLIILLISVVDTQILWSQTGKSTQTNLKISAVIKDSQGNKIIGAKIYGNQGDVVVSSDNDGAFTIQVQPNSYLLIESEGYNSLNIKSLDANNQDLILTKTPFLLGENEIVSMAFKYVPKALSVGNVSDMNVPDILKQDNVTRVQSLLDSYGAGMKGGYNLLGLGDALVIVDGLPRDASYLLTEEIESISILKVL
jgi:hypothetical protein